MMFILISQNFRVYFVELFGFVRDVKSNSKKKQKNRKLFLKESWFIGGFSGGTSSEGIPEEVAGRYASGTSCEIHGKSLRLK